MRSPHPFSKTTDGGYIVAGTTYPANGDVTGNHGGGDFWMSSSTPVTLVIVPLRWHVFFAFG